MSRYDLVCFDFDGTLMDTSSGIFHCARTSMARVGVPIPPGANMNLFVGPPLRDCFTITFGVTDPGTLDRLTAAYRDEYSAKGRFMAVPYPGMTAALDRLRSCGIAMAVTTNKNTVLAEAMNRHFGLEGYFFGVYGTGGAGDKGTKPDFIRRAMADAALADCPRRVLMVGDTMLDARGAGIAGCDFLGVGFGFGEFTPEQVATFDYPLLKDYSELLGIVLG